MGELLVLRLRQVIDPLKLNDSDPLEWCFEFRIDHVSAICRVVGLVSRDGHKINDVLGGGGGLG